LNEHRYIHIYSRKCSCIHIKLIYKRLELLNALIEAFLIYTLPELTELDGNSENPYSLVTSDPKTIFNYYFGTEIAIYCYESIL